MITRRVKLNVPLLLICLSSVFTAGIAGQETPAPHSGASQEDLQKATQNPVSSLISFPFQNVTDMNIGPFGREKNTLNIQPVIRLH